MVTVYNKSQLNAAIKANEPIIEICGELGNEVVEKIKKKKKIKKSALIVGTVSFIAGAALIPFTSGASAGVMAIASGLTATAAATTVTVTSAELLIIVGAVLGALALIKGYEVIKINKDGVTIKKKCKN